MVHAINGGSDHFPRFQEQFARLLAAKRAISAIEEPPHNEVKIHLGSLAAAGVKPAAIHNGVTPLFFAWFTSAFPSSTRKDTTSTCPSWAPTKTH